MYTLSNILRFKKELFFEGAVQIDWFYNSEKSALVSKSFVFHGREYFGTNDKKLTDTISFVNEISNKLNSSNANPLSMVIAGYGTGKSHLAVTLAQLLSGENYMPEVHDTILNNVSSIDYSLYESIKNSTSSRNFVIVINGMRDFNLHYEILKNAKKSLELYGLSTEFLQKLDKSKNIASTFLERNYHANVEAFERFASSNGINLVGESLYGYLKYHLDDDANVFNTINDMYEHINGHKIRWDEDVQASVILDTLVAELCNDNSIFDNVVVIFDEFGRYLEYIASNPNAVGDTALQQIFECVQNANGKIQWINFLQSDIKAYLTRTNSKNIERYVNRFDNSQKYYLSSNLETVFANLIVRTPQFCDTVKVFLSSREEHWRTLYDDIRKHFKCGSSVWQDYTLFRNVIVEGVYPMHPMAVLMLTNLSDYLQNRSSMTLLSRYIESLSDVEVSAESSVYILAEQILDRELLEEFLSAEQKGKIKTTFCIKYDNIIRNSGSKLQENDLKVLRSNLVLRLLNVNMSHRDPLNTGTQREEYIKLLSYCCDLTIPQINDSIYILEEEYAIIGYDELNNTFDFLENSTSAYDFKNFFNPRVTRSILNTAIFKSDMLVRTKAEVIEALNTSFNTSKGICTNEWQYSQDLVHYTNLTKNYISGKIFEWQQANDVAVPKGFLVWVYCNDSTNTNTIIELSKLVEDANAPIVIMLLNDVSKGLERSLVEYQVLSSFTNEEREKYDKYYSNAYSKSISDIASQIDLLKRDKLMVTPSGVQQIPSRLTHYLTNVFERIYSKALPFNFDGFENKVLGKAKKMYISIWKLLLSKNIDSIVIKNYPIDERNRIVATLGSEGQYSWKVINSDGNVTAPSNPQVHEVYSILKTKFMTSPQGLNCHDVYRILLNAPYGMNYYSATYMIGVLCANYRHCMQVKYKFQELSLDEWNEQIISGAKAEKFNFDIIDKSVLVKVKTESIAERYNSICKIILANDDIFKVEQYSQDLEALKSKSEVPLDVKEVYYQAKEHLDTGANVYNKYQRKYIQLKSQYKKAIEKSSVIIMARAYTELCSANCPIKNCFKGSKYKPSQKSVDDISSLTFKAKKYIDDNFTTWLEKRVLTKVEDTTNYKNAMNEYEKVLLSGNFKEYAECVAKKRDVELANADKIKEKKNLLDDISNFQKVNIKLLRYQDLKPQIERGEVLLAQLETFKDYIYQEYTECYNIVSGAIAELQERLDGIRESMNLVYDSVYSVSTLSDVSKLLTNIEDILKYDLTPTDTEDFTELQSYFLGVQRDVSTFERDNFKALDRDRLANDYGSLLQKYQDSEYSIGSVISSTYNAILSTMDTKCSDWESTYISTFDYLNGSINSLMQWQKDTSILPKYLTQNVIESYRGMAINVEERLSKNHVDTAVQTFYNLSESEQEEFLRRILAK